MKFICNKETIFHEISNAKDFTSQKTAENQYTFVYLELSNNNLIIKTTDQKMGYYSIVNVSGEENGSLMVNCDKFLEILRTLPETNISFTLNKEFLLIKPDNSKININLITKNDLTLPFPTIPEDNSFFSVPQTVFTHMINSVIFAVSEDESKFNMTGVYFETEDNNLIMVGTDSRRLSCVEIKMTDKIPEFDGIIIPTKFLNILKKQSQEEGEFKVSVTSNTIFIKMSNCIYFSNLIKEEFPAYRRVIPVSLANKCIIEKDKFESALKRCATVIDDNKFKKVIIEINDNLLTLSTGDNTSVGNIKEEIDCEYSGEPTKVGMNYSYILSPFKVINSKNISIEFSAYPKPFIFRSVPESDTIHLIMPMDVD